MFLDDVSLTAIPAPTGAVGTLVSSIVGSGSGPNNVSDPDTGALTGIAITATSNALLGVWYYSINNGTTWTSPVMLAVPSPAGVFAHPTGAVSPSGKIAVTWVDAGSDGGASNEVFLAWSSDGGKTFTTKQYPDPTAAIAGDFGPVNPVVGWENDDVLWLAQTLDVGNTATLYVDKTCDGGQTWSGIALAGAYSGSSLVLTNAGMMASGFDTQNLVTIPLAAP